MKNHFQIQLFFIITFCCLLSSCNAVKHVPESKHLLQESSIIINDKKNKDSSIDEFIIQRPNTKILNTPISLHLHNLYNSGFTTDYEIWKAQKPKAHQFLKNIFSEKQAFAYRKFKENTNNWFFKTFESPVLLNTKKTKKTAKNLEAYYFQEGYFRAKVTYEEILKPSKKAFVKYFVNTGNPTFIDSISTKIYSPVLDSIYDAHKEETLIKKDTQFKYRVMENELERISKLYRNNGIFHFNKSVIGIHEVDTISADYKTSIKTVIENRPLEKNDSIFTVPFKIQKIKNINIYTDYTYSQRNEPYNDTIKYKGFTFISHEKNKYNEKLLSNSLFIEKNSIYKDIDRDLTRKHFRSLQNFKLVNIKYKELDDENLETAIYLTPFKKFRLGFNAEATHSNIKPFGISGKVSILTRNAFKGAEILKFSVQGSFLNSNDVADNINFFNAWEVGADLSLDIPRFILPFNTNKIIPKTMSPRTEISLGTSLQKNIGLDKQKFTGIIDYTWQSSPKKSHSFELLNAQFIQNLNSGSYFNIYNSEYTKLNDLTISNPTYFDSNGNLIENLALDYANYINDPSNGFEITNATEYQIATNVKNRNSIITEDVFVPSAAYEFTYNNSSSYKDTDFSFFRARVVSSGNFITSLVKKPTDGSSKKLLGIEIAQYIRADLEYKKFWNFSSNNILAFRSFLGIANPYGNSEVIPFSRSYFIGGPNDLRAWKIYDLGPGKTNSGLEYNIGNLKFLTSLEYRFKFFNSINGALFIDAGNIWDTTDASFNTDDAKFNGLKSLNDIAIGSGVGIRYDFNFLVFRLDLGFKTYEPYLQSSNKFFQNYNFSNAVWNIGINYPF